MNELIGINIYEKIPQIIEYYIKFYGEEYRELITERITNANIRFYSSPEELGSYIAKKKREIVESLAVEYIKKIGYEPTPELIRKTLNSSSSLEDSPIEEIYRMFNEEQSLFEKGKSEYFFNSLLTQLKIEKNSKEEQELIEKIQKNKEFFELLKLKELALKQIYEPLSKQFEEINKLKERITFEAQIKLLKEFEFLLDDHDRKIINSDEEINLNVLHCKEILFGKQLKYKSAIEYFSKEDEEILESGNSYVKNSIMENRIKYFNSIGIKLGNDYELYEQNEECQKKKPSFELVKTIQTKREKTYKEIIEECILRSDEYNSILKANSSLNLGDIEIFNPTVAREGNTYVSTNFTYQDNEAKICPILYFCYSKNSDYSDVLFNHELNHIVELMLIGITDENKINVKSGFENIVSEIGKFEQVKSLKEKKRRGTELFNEVINQMIAEDITKMMHEDGFHMFSNERNAQIYGITNTTIAHPIIRPFYECYKKEITESRLNGSMEPLINAVGEENFYELNEQIIELIPIDRFQLRIDKNSNKQSELVEKYERIINNIYRIYSNINAHERSIKESSFAK